MADTTAKTQQQETKKRVATRRNQRRVALLLFWRLKMTVKPRDDETANPSRFIGKPEMLDRVAASYPTVWQWMREGKFPRSRELGGRSVWLEAEIEQWIVTRPIRPLKGDANAPV